jgi:hypothetical protein
MHSEVRNPSIRDEKKSAHEKCSAKKKRTLSSSVGYETRDHSETIERERERERESAPERL